MSAVVSAMLVACRRATTTPSFMSVFSRHCSSQGPTDTSDTSRPSRRDRYHTGLREFKSPSVYKTNPKPTRYGYTQKHYDGGPLPRLDIPIKSLPEYRPKDAFSKEKALYGQNDYIDILGDGSIKPYETHKGPEWLVGFYGNEFSRTFRRLKFTGEKLAALRPKLYNELMKRQRYLYKIKNHKRKRGVIPKYI